MSDVASPTGLTVVEDVCRRRTDPQGQFPPDHGREHDAAADVPVHVPVSPANNFGGMWHPSGVSAPPEVLALVSLLIPVVALLALWAVSRGIARGTTNLNGLLWLALAFVVLTGAVRILMMYQFGWDLQNGTYIDISTVWYGVVLAEFIMVGLWVLSIVMGHVRGTAPITAMQARVVVEQWSFITVVSFAVYALIEFVT